MADNNTFENVMKSLLEGANGVLSSKTVVGAPVTVGDTIIIPLSDVSIGLGAGADNADRKDGGAGAFSAKMSPSAVLVIRDGVTKVVNIKEQNYIAKIVDIVPEMVDKVITGVKTRDMMGDDEATEIAFGDENTENA